jgi:hypothetical protein
MAKQTEYVSEFTNFIQNLYGKNPALFQKQQELLNTWWNKDFMEKEDEELVKTRLKPDPYPYYTYHYQHSEEDKIEQI